VRVYRQELTLEDAIGSHACSLEANTRVTNGIPLGSSPLLPVDTVNCVATPKGSASLLANVAAWDVPPVLWCFGHVHESRGGVRADLKEVVLHAPPTVVDDEGVGGEPIDGVAGAGASVNSNTSGGGGGETAVVATPVNGSLASTLCLNASNANNGRAGLWPQGRPPMLVRLLLE
jgi:hypothetical protein